MIYKTKDLYSLDHTLAGEYLRQFDYPWEALAGIKAYIQTLGRNWRIQRSQPAGMGA